MQYIRRATGKDASRIAEILIFTKRVSYRSIFQCDSVSFGKMQVLPLAQSLLRDTSLLNSYQVYDDGFVKGVLRTDGTEICELYVEPFFQGCGIGASLLSHAVKNSGCTFLWVLEKNPRAISFYRKHGFVLTGERKPEEGTTESVLKMSLDPDSV